VKISRVAQARIDAEHILTVLSEIYSFSASMGTEVKRVENLGIPLARMISAGLVATVTADGADILSETVRDLSAIVTVGIPALQAVEPHVTILEYVPFGRSEPTRVLVLGIDGWRLRVTVPGSLIGSKWMLHMTDSATLATLKIVDPSV
jgi:hypothetical protein